MTKRDRFMTELENERRNPGNPCSARCGGLYTGLCQDGRHWRWCRYAVIPGEQRPVAVALRQCHDVEAVLQAGQAPAEGCRDAATSIVALVPGDGDHRPVDAGDSAGRYAVSGRSCGAANDRALQPAAEEGDAEHRRADFDSRTAGFRGRKTTCWIYHFEVLWDETTMLKAAILPGRLGFVREDRQASGSSNGDIDGTNILTRYGLECYTGRKRHEGCFRQKRPIARDTSMHARMTACSGWKRLLIVLYSMAPRASIKDAANSKLLHAMVMGRTSLTARNSYEVSLGHF
jgi:hypothetical protein